MHKIEQSLSDLQRKLRQKKRRTMESFDSFLALIAENPARCLRNIFQLFNNMIHHYIPTGVNEYPNDPESINYIHYDCSRLFVSNTENPFFADRLLANRLVNVVDSLKEGVLRNKMLVFVGPPGSGKSTFLNNVLHKLELYTALDEGAMYETVWRIDVEKFGLPYLPSLFDFGENNHCPLLDRNKQQPKPDRLINASALDKWLIIPCPSHDHPLMQIPKPFRRKILDDIIEDESFKHDLFIRREYEWLFKSSPCAVCSSIYRALSDKCSPEEILRMLYVRRYEFSRKLGEGVSIFNPGDKVEKDPLRNQELQKWIDAIFKDSNAVSYLYSRLAKTNNGVFAIMDAKSNNVDRIQNIHGVISDGVHKVGNFEETISSLFMLLVNPEDMDVIDKQKSFQDRVLKLPIPYVRDYNTEVQIYRSFFGTAIENDFLPRVLKEFAKVIVASRLHPESKAVKEWIRKPAQYRKFCDRNMLLLKMEIFGGQIPFWLSEADVKRLDRKTRWNIIMVEGEQEGRIGFSGRESLDMFNHFYNRYRKRNGLIGIDHVYEFFHDGKFSEKISGDLLESLVNLYNFTVLQEVKEAMFFYNEQQIATDIKNYLFAISNDMGTEVENPLTQERLEITETYFEAIEIRLLGSNAGGQERRQFRDESLHRYVARTLQETNRNVPIEHTDQFKALQSRYNQNLKQNVLAPFASNDIFRMAVKEYGHEAFEKYDKRLRNEVTLLMKNLRTKFAYTEQGARQICLYVIDKELVDQFNE